jgi:hypothetical protein
MRLVIAGGRDFNDYGYVKYVLNELRKHFKIDSILTGHGCGADMLGERYADEHLIPLELYPAKWGEYGKSAGPRRNEEMAENADAVVLFPGGKGTEHMHDMAVKYNLNIFDFRDKKGILSMTTSNKK